MKTLAAFIIALFIIGIEEVHAQVEAGVTVQVGIAPPVLPVYVQPPCPIEGYMWMPGYWAYGPDGYYWVPGVWVSPPTIDFLWTPGYWGFEDGAYFWHRGYWGPHIGFYGGVCYGFGYTGVGFYGGRWEGGAFRYNTAVWNVNSRVIHNTYVDRTVIRNSGNRTSFNGPGGVSARPTPEEQSAAREKHTSPTTEQLNHEHNASTNREQLASVNRGRPATTAMSSAKSSFNSSNHSTSTNKATHGATNSNPHTNSLAPQTQHSPHQNRTGSNSQHTANVQQHNQPQNRSSVPHNVNLTRGSSSMRNTGQPHGNPAPMHSGGARGKH